MKKIDESECRNNYEMIEYIISDWLHQIIWFLTWIAIIISTCKWRELADCTYFLFILIQAFFFFFSVELDSSLLIIVFLLLFLAFLFEIYLSRERQQYSYKELAPR